MHWSSRLPDLNPIEHLWHDLDRCVRQHQPPPQSHRQLEQAIQQEWLIILQAQIQHLVEFMPRRVTAVLQANVGHNKYLNLRCVNWQLSEKLFDLKWLGHSDNNRAEFQNTIYLLSVINDDRYLWSKCHFFLRCVAFLSFFFFLID